MMNNHSKPKALLIGDYKDAPYHPLEAVEEKLLQILESGWQVSTTDQYDSLLRENNSAYRLYISYADRWDRPVSSEQTAGLLSYVAEGGGLLVLHNGISLQARPEMAQMIGARFTGHPAYQELGFHVEMPEHPVTAGIRPFTMEEEPYRFEMAPLSDHEVLLTYHHEGERYPATWARSYGLGRIAYLMPGHHLESFLHPEYAKLIQNAANWAGRLNEEKI
ncbi:ThuA domain-containing protein [Paenibacillus sp. DYY-L-2]|uniref:ThuA domain-containing protein n=1 Tax=Paenibacillus sp. DYY-L-2 TaxID=3447013 RepID=UPI003F4F3F6E